MIVALLITGTNIQINVITNNILHQNKKQNIKNLIQPNLVLWKLKEQ